MESAHKSMSILFWSYSHSHSLLNPNFTSLSQWRNVQHSLKIVLKIKEYLDGIYFK